MLQYLIILLDDTSTSFCHYNNNKTEPKAIPLDTLRKAIRFAMTENLMIQFVYPDYLLPNDMIAEIETIDHSKIKPVNDEEADVFVLNKWDFTDLPAKIPVVLRTSKSQLLEKYEELDMVLEKVMRLNIIITDLETFNDEDFSAYRLLLNHFSKKLQSLYLDGMSPQLNILTDRMMLKEMNNCGAGDSSVTLAPNGRFYVCPAFYLENEDDFVGDLENGLDIANQQLYKLDHAPICRRCDAYQCRRCVWLNRKTTLEVNTPSHEQCVVAHLERNASKSLLSNIRKLGEFLPEYEDIKEIDYIDPFDSLEDL